jgi:hypothetical protein
MQMVSSYLWRIIDSNAELMATLADRAGDTLLEEPLWKMSLLIFVA